MLTANRRLISLLVLFLMLAGVLPAAAQSGVSLTITEVSAAPRSDQAAYAVTAYVSVVDDQGQPVTGLQEGNFQVSQDGSAVELETVSIATRPASMVLVIDTSGSMAGEGKMDAAKAAAIRFIDGLDETDQVAVIYFSDTVEIAQNLSGDHQAAQSIVGLLEYTPRGGTCLRDAAYEAITLASGGPPGQRAVVVLTDGIDETAARSGPCSAHTADQVIAHANEGATPIPIYAIGVGSTVDAAELGRLAGETGGDALAAPSASEISGLFNAVLAQLKNQYALVYNSATTAGEHQITVSAGAGGSVAVAARTFITPPLLSLTGLDDGALLDGARTVRATVGGSASIRSVQFVLGEEVIAEDTSAPFEVVLDSTGLEEGAYSLSAFAMLEDGTQLAAQLDFEVGEQAPLTGAGADAQPDREEEQPQQDEEQGADRATRETESSALGQYGWLIPVGVVGAVVMVGAVGAMIFLATRPKRSAGSPGMASPTDATMDGLGFGELLATLTVGQSLSLRPGQPFDMMKDRVTMGRGASNDIIIPDAPVSREHAEIRLTNASFWLYDRDSRYGTFVGNQRVEGAGQLLRDGDEIFLGRRTSLIFRSARAAPAGANDRTMDMPGYGDETSDLPGR